MILLRLGAHGHLFRLAASSYGFACPVTSNKIELEDVRGIDAPKTRFFVDVNDVVNSPRPQILSPLKSIG